MRSKDNPLQVEQHLLDYFWVKERKNQFNVSGSNLPIGPMGQTHPLDPWGKERQFGNVSLAGSNDPVRKEKTIKG